MKFRAAVLNKVNEPMTLDTLEMAALAPADVLVQDPGQRSVPHRPRSDPGLARVSAADRARPRGRRGRRSCRRRGHAGEARRPRDLFLESALRPLLLLRARPADPVRAVHPQPAERSAARRHVAHAPCRRTGAPLLGHLDACRIHGRAGVRRDRSAEGDSLRPRLHHRLRRHDRCRRGRAQGQGRSRVRASW